MVCLLVQTAVHVYFRRILGVAVYETSRPTVPKVVRDILVGIPLCELLFYSFHALLHRPRLYRRIHKVHHSYTAPIALAAQFAHPVEHVLTFYVPVMLAPAAVRANVLSMWIFVGMVGFESCTVHSGFRVSALAERHDRHHKKGMQGGYGTFRFLDWIFGTEMKELRPDQEVVRDKNA